MLTPQNSPASPAAVFATRLSTFGVRHGFVALGAHDPASIESLSEDVRSDALTTADVSLATGRAHRHNEGLELAAFPWDDGATVVELTSSEGVSADRLFAVLSLFHADLLQAQNDAKAIDGFNQQLSQSYEEVNLIYRMAKLLTSEAQPAEVVQEMCEHLRETLNYGWLAMNFTDHPVVLPGLKRTLMHAGTLPCPTEQFASVCPAAGDTQNILLPGRDGLATLAKAEVLVEPVRQDEEAIGVVVAGNRRGAESDVTSSELQLVSATTGFFGLFHQNLYRFEQQRLQFLGTLHALSAAVDAKDPYTQGHSQRVALLGKQLALAIGLDEATADAVRVAGLLHDIGKIGVPEAVLCKPAKLTDDEFALIKKHPEVGYNILKDIPSLAFHLPGVLHHHERWDGRGYPHKLAGEAIPQIARILAFADTFDAMSSNRAYRRGLTREHVLAEIRKSGGTQLDPAMVEAFVTLDFGGFDAMLATQISQQSATVNVAAAAA